MVIINARGCSRSYNRNCNRGRGRGGICNRLRNYLRSRSRSGRSGSIRTRTGSDFTLNNSAGSN